MSTESFRPRRSALYMPASNARAIEKARGLPSDGIIFDLEDAVGPDAKPQARESAVAAVRSGRYGRRELAIRINGEGTPWHEEDLAAAAAAGPDAIVVPKVDSAEQVHRLVVALEGAGAPDHTELWAMLETPGAILAAPAIAAASPRLAVLVLGSNDLVKELHAEHTPGREPLLAAMSWAVLAARAAGVDILDAVYNDVRDIEGFTREAEQARRMGFDGKTLIHPSQVEPANTVFAPDSGALDDARGVVAAWAKAGGAGVVTYNGRMIEQLHVDTAHRLIGMHEAISALEQGH